MATTNEILDELIALRKYKADMESNPYTVMYEGLKHQWEALARELKTTTISIAGDDKAFDRFAKLMEKLAPMTDNIEKLRKKIGLENAEEPKAATKKNPVEETAR